MVSAVPAKLQTRYRPSGEDDPRERSQPPRPGCRLISFDGGPWNISTLSNRWRSSMIGHWVGEFAETGSIHMLATSKATIKLPNDTVVAAVIDWFSTGVTEFVEACSGRYPMNNVPRCIFDIKLLHRRKAARRPFGDDQRVAGLVGMVAITSVWIECRRGGIRVEPDCYRALRRHARNLSGARRSPAARVRHIRWCRPGPGQRTSSDRLRYREAVERWRPVLPRRPW